MTRHAPTMSPTPPRRRIACGLVAVASSLLVAAPALAAAPAASSAAPASPPAPAIAGPCSSRLPDRRPLAAERARIAAVDAALKARNVALERRRAALDRRDLAAVAAYDRDVAALHADATANDRAWDAYQARRAAVDREAREALRCGRLATGARHFRQAGTPTVPRPQPVRASSPGG